MKGVVLHGGQGTRLRPLTQTGPKQLIKIGGKPISQWGIEALRDLGITQVAVILGDNNPLQVIDYYGDGAKFGVELTYIYQGKAGGLAQAIGLTRDFVKDDRFIVYLGDNVVLDGLNELSNFKGSGSVMLAHVDDPGRYGIAEVKDGKVEKLVEKPKNPESDLALVGVYGFTNEIFDSIDKLKPSWRGELEITEAIQDLVDRGLKLDYTIIEGWWKDTGTPSDLLNANMRLLDRYSKYDVKGDLVNSRVEGRVTVETGAQIKNSTVIGPCHIGQSVLIEDSYIGPFTTIGDNSKIKGSEIGNTIVFDEASCKEVHVTGSIIGHRTVVTKIDTKPYSSKLIVGEGSFLSI